jgi:hypothetical protein
MPLAAPILPIANGGTGALVANGSFSLFNAGGIAVSNPSIPAIAGRSCRLVIRGSTTGTSAGGYVGAALNSAVTMHADKMTLGAATTTRITGGAFNNAPIADTAAARSSIYAQIDYKSPAEGSAVTLISEYIAGDGAFSYHGFFSSGAGVANQLNLSSPLGVTFAGTWELYI